MVLRRGAQGGLGIDLSDRAAWRFFFFLSRFGGIEKGLKLLS